MAVMGAAGRVAVTLVAVVAAVAIGWRVWVHYTLAPWTRDARVLATIVQIAPDVSGPISAVNVVDNQLVAKGDVLFVIDQERFKVALQKAQAQVDALERTASTADQALAERNMALAALSAAQIDLSRSEVRAPANGYVTNLTAAVGDYARVGTGVLALVDAGSFYVYAYFMETKLPQIRDGDKARVELMAGGVVLDGVVQGMSRAIANPGSSGGLLATVNPEFDWIRLAQRIPVRIDLGPVPPTVRLASGMSATVVVTPAAR